MNSRWLRHGFVYLLIVAAVFAILFTLFRSPSGEDIPLSGPQGQDSVVSLVKGGRVDRIEVDGGDLTVHTEGGTEYHSTKETDISIYEVLERAGVPRETVNGVEIQVKGSGGLSGILGILVNFLPLIFLGVLLLFIMRQAQGNSNQTMNFGRSRARMVVGNKPTVTFDDVAGVEESKRELQEVVEFLRYPERFASLGARIPKGLLLIGPPGTGKTLLAKAVAGEAGVPFFSLSGSEFVEMFVGVGAARVRDLFEQARRNAPCIIFVDEIDAVGRLRGAGLGGGHDEREQTLNQILVEMDGFDTATHVIVMAATNRPDILDPALLRPGRFDRRVMLDNPDINGREAILQVHAKGKPIADEVDLRLVARETPGFSGADLGNLVNEAALLAAREGKQSVGMDEFGEAVERIIAGPERRSRVLSPKEKEVTAYHEAGHALVGWTLPDGDPVHKISIVARGGVGGYTRFLPEEDRHLWTRAQFEDMLATALGGRVAEELTFNEITTGATNDLDNATQVARQMVTRYGMTYRFVHNEMAFSQLLEELVSSTVDSIDMYRDDLLVTMKDGWTYRCRKEEDFSLADFLHQQGLTTGVNGSGPKLYVKASTLLEGLGPRTFGRRDETVFLGKELGEQRDYSDRVAEAIDEEVQSLLRRGYERARDVLLTKRAKLAQIARYLIVHESVEGKDLQELFESEPPADEVDTSASPQPAAG